MSDQATETETPTTTTPPTPSRKPRTRGREKREIMCALTKAELRARGARMARAELEGLELGVELDQHKNRARLVKAKIDDLADERAKLARAIDSKQEPRPIDCEWVESTEQNAWLLLRLDTRAQIDVKPMSANERQLGLGIEDPKPDEAEPVDGEAKPGKRKSARAKATNGKTKHEH